MWVIYYDIIILISKQGGVRMKKLKRILTALIILVVVLAGGLYYMILPDENQKNLSSDAEEISMQQMIELKFIEKMELKKNPARFEGIVSLSEQDVENIIYTFMKKSGNESIMPKDISISEGKIIVSVPVNIAGIDTVAEVSMTPYVSNQNICADIENIKVGKLNISGKLFGEIYQYNRNDENLSIEKNTIMIGSSIIDPIKSGKIYIEGNYLKADISIMISDMMKYISSSAIEGLVK